MGYLLVILFCLPFFNLFSQTNNFAPIGAKWWYNAVSYCGGPGTECGYFTMESKRDTLLMGRNARVLEVEYYEVASNFGSHIEIMYEDSGRVYHYKKDSFYVLYDFNVNQGDTIVIWDSSFTGYLRFGENDVFNKFIYIVDSITTDTIDGNIFKVVYPKSSSLLSEWSFAGEFGARIIERIGNTWLMFGYPTPVILESSGGLRCYEDSLLSYKPYTVNTGRPCDYITTDLVEPGVIKRQIVSNVFTTNELGDFLYRFVNTENVEILIYNALGQLINYEIYQLIPGVYLLEIKKINKMNREVIKIMII